MSDRGHVFIVDDGSTSADMLQDMLKDSGYTVDRAAPDQDALRAIASAEPNIVLLDAHLPDINPFDLRDRLKSSRQALDVPVIFITTLDDAEALALSAWASDATLDAAPAPQATPPPAVHGRAWVASSAAAAGHHCRHRCSGWSCARW